MILPSLINSLGENHAKNPKFDVLQPLREWLDNIQIDNRKFAKLIAKLIPAQCPFERDIVLFGRKIAHIPPMCKLNPFYDQFVGLRFRALCYLVDECGEDIQSYC
ncbi:Mo-dependent nitrogenase family protein [Richelia sinica FACHB-800]|uniref:Mo-dependent nitrogenase family protein n=2 Tax=Richelia TaxID=98443 RepID=A0A975T8C5_9NOST|nr:Mo-dependent nitrogenase family protein [Richelia sinica FACHB-800]